MDKNKKNKWEENLIDIVKLYDEIKHIDKSLETLHPIAIVQNNTFFVFDYDKPNNKYYFAHEEKVPNMQIPDKILASFPLDFYNMKPSAVVSEDALETLEKQVFIFHEFVHCYQYETVEQDIKNTLKIYNKYQNENNYMWELNHPFPYDNPDFIQKTNMLIKYYKEKDSENILNYYKHMKSTLSNIDYEYLIWQEWKEGYARFVENNIRSFFNLKLNDKTIKEPFSRPSFYWMGNRHIEFIINTMKTKISSLDVLFDAMV